MAPKQKETPVIDALELALSNWRSLSLASSRAQCLAPWRMAGLGAALFQASVFTEPNALFSSCRHNRVRRVELTVHRVKLAPSHIGG